METRSRGRIMTRLHVKDLNELVRPELDRFLGERLDTRTLAEMQQRVNEIFVDLFTSGREFYTDANERIIGLKVVKPIENANAVALTVLTDHWPQ